MTSQKEGASSSSNNSGEGRRVLIAMDGSEHSFYAFDWFMEFVHTDGMEVIVAHSGHLNHQRPFLMPMMSSDPAMIGRIIQMHEDEINSIVDKIKSKLSGHGIRGRLLRLHGEAGHAIVKAAETHKVSCIVTGSRGLGSIRRTMLGSVSDYILHHAHVPVLVCRHKEVPAASSSKSSPAKTPDASPEPALAEAPAPAKASPSPRPSPSRSLETIQQAQARKGGSAPRLSPDTLHQGLANNAPRLSPTRMVSAPQLLPIRMPSSPQEVPAHAPPRLSPTRMGSAPHLSPVKMSSSPQETPANAQRLSPTRMVTTPQLSPTKVSNAARLSPTKMINAPQLSPKKTPPSPREAPANAPRLSPVKMLDTAQEASAKMADTSRHSPAKMAASPQEATAKEEEKREA